MAPAGDALAFKREVECMLNMLLASPTLLLFVLIAVGAYLGSLRIKTLSIGPAAVLFAALALSALNPKLELPTIIGTLGLSLFAYTIGVTCGPAFFGSLCGGAKPMAAIVAVLSVSGAGVYALGHVLHLRAGSIAGLFAGSLTNTPALAAATDRLHGATSPTVAYSITYLFGVIGMIAAAWFALRRGRTAPVAADIDKPDPIVTVTVAVSRRDLPTLGHLAGMHQNEIVFGRVRHGDERFAATKDVTLRPGDLVTVIGPATVVSEISDWLGECTNENLALDRRFLDFRRITVSRHQHAGHTIGQLGLGHRFGAVVTRIRRGDVDLVATADQHVEPGDRLRVVAPRAKLAEVATYLGDSETGMSDINPFGMALGLALGIALGMVSIPMFGIGSFVLGAAGGPLIVGLILGRLHRTGPIAWGIPHSASASLNQFGLYAFLAWAGSHAGGQFVTALTSPLGLKLALAGFLVTSATAVAIITVCRHVFKISGPQLAGMLAAAQTQPAVLAFAADQANGDERVNVGWALIYPAAMITKIVIATVLAGL